MSYHLTGWLSATTFLFTLWGLGTQLRFIWLRRLDVESRGLSRIPEGEGEGEAGAPTAVLSLNQFFSSYLAFYSFLLYGVCQPRFNHYLVWPRFMAALLTLWIVYQIWLDRRNARAAAALVSGLGMLVMAPAAVLVSPGWGAWGQKLIQGQVVLVTLILVQGYLHQVLVIRSSGRTGAVSLLMHQCFLLKDLSTMAFAMAMGLREGWPILFLSFASAVTKVITIWHFRWVRISSIAAARRTSGAIHGVSKSGFLDPVEP